jgi:hypothetical protein
MLAQSVSNPQITRVTGPDALRPAEVAVAIDPADADHLVAVSGQGGRPGGPRFTDFAYASFDGGRTWTTTPTDNGHDRVHGDDSITIARDGTAYHAFIAFDGIRVARADRASSGIYVESSRDGVKWTTPVPVVDHINTAIPFEDKPWVTVDDAQDSPNRGNVYVAWTRFDVYGSNNPEDKSHIWFSRSRDGGRTFMVPVRVSDQPGDAKDSDGTVEGAVPAIGLNGEVYLVWAGPKGLMFDKSTDGGYSWGADAMIATLPGGWDEPVKGLERHNGMPVTAVDHSTGPNRGTLYVNWMDERNGKDDPDVFLISSRDGGRTWSPPLRVNDDPKGNRREQLFSWMAVDRADGSVNIAFLDRRDFTDTQQGLTLARSVDGGRTFVNHKLPIRPFTIDEAVFYGDYIGIGAQAGRVAILYPRPAPAPNNLLIESVLVRFKPGSQESVDLR